MKTKLAILAVLAGLCISPSAFSLRFDQVERGEAALRIANDNCNLQLRGSNRCTGTNERGCMRAAKCTCVQSTTCPRNQ